MDRSPTQKAERNGAGMDRETARAILEEAIREELFEGEMPEGSALLEQAEYFLAEAYKAHNAGMNMPVIDSIMRLGGWEPELSSSGDEEPSDDGAVDVSSTAQDLQEPEPSPVQKSSQFVPKEKLPVPDEIEGDPKPMPRDLSAISDIEIRRLSGEQNAFLARVTWLLALAQQDVRNAEHLRDAEYRKALLSYKQDQVARGEKVTMSEAEKVAASNDDVMAWDSELVAHQNVVDSYKALREIYKGNLDRLSREASMRQDEWLRAGGKRS